MLAICIPSMLYFTSIHHHCPHASYMYTYMLSLLLFIPTALMLAICIPSMLSSLFIIITSGEVMLTLTAIKCFIKSCMAKTSHWITGNNTFQSCYSIKINFMATQVSTITFSFISTEVTLREAEFILEKLINNFTSAIMDHQTFLRYRK